MGTFASRGYDMVAKYLGITLDAKLKLNKHVKTKRQARYQM